jgi:hypothetical protein
MRVLPCDDGLIENNLVLNQNSSTTIVEEITDVKRTRHGNASGLSTMAKGKGGSVSSIGTSRVTTLIPSRSSSAIGKHEETIDSNRPHWILRIICDADKTVGRTIKT